MRHLLFTCPRSGNLIQGSVAADAIGPATVYVPVDCPICHRPHIIDLKTGKVPESAPKPKG